MRKRSPQTEFKAQIEALTRNIKTAEEWEDLTR